MAKVDTPISIELSQADVDALYSVLSHGLLPDNEPAFHRLAQKVASLDPREAWTPSKSNRWAYGQQP